MFYVVSVMMLGYTRTHGLQVYDSSNRSFPEVTPATAKKLIAEGTLNQKSNQVRQLKISFGIGVKKV